jgi:hypothetical protein
MVVLGCANVIMKWSWHTGVGKLLSLVSVKNTMFPRPGFPEPTDLVQLLRDYGETVAGGNLSILRNYA